MEKQTPTPRIEHLPEKKMLGKSIRMSLADNKTYALWSGFMPLRKHITRSIGSELYSLQVYDSFSPASFSPKTEFTKYALVEVEDFKDVPKGMQSFILEEGLYAVFPYKGTPEGFPQLMAYIFSQWLPSSDYALDDRPHFELLGEKYKNNDPDSEEEVWIPIKQKK